MATISENISSTPLPEEKPEGYENQPLRNKVGNNPMMNLYDSVLSQNSERVKERRSQQSLNDPKGDRDYRKDVRDFFEERRIAAEAQSLNHNEGRQEEGMSEEVAREMAKRILRERKVGIDRIAAGGIKKDEGVESGGETTENKEEVVHGIHIDLSKYDPSKSTEEYDLKGELGGALDDLKEDEVSILKDSGFNIVTQGEEVMYPVYLEETNTLNVGFLNTGEDILNAIRNTVIPHIKESQSKPEESSVDQEPTLENAAPNQEEKSIDSVENSEKDKIVGDLKKLREEFAKMDALGHNFSGETGKSFFSLKDEYNAKKEELAELLKAEIRGADVYGHLTPDQEKEFKSKFNDELYNLLNSENDSYNASIKKIRGEGVWGKAKEKFKEGAIDLLGTKGMKWYMGLSRTQRFAINTALFSTIAAGVAFLAPTGTAATAVGAWAYRVARGVGSFGGSGLGMWGSNKILKPEQLNEWKIQEEQKIKDSEDSIEEKSRKIEELEKEFDRRLRNLNLKKIGMTALAGGIGGAISGGILDAYYSGGTTGGSAVENLGHKSNINEHLGGAKTTPVEHMDTHTGSNVEVPEPSHPEVAEGVVKETTSLGEAGNTVESPEVLAAKILGDPSAAEQSVPKGGSLWGITRSALEHNERFQHLTSGQKNNVISYYTNKTINDPKIVGLEPYPKYGVRLEPDQKVNLSKLFSDQDEFEKVMKRAESLSPDLEKQGEKVTKAVEALHKENPGKDFSDKEVLDFIAKFNDKAPDSFAPSTASGFDSHADSGMALDNNPETIHADIEAAKARLAELENQAPIAKPKIYTEMPSKSGVVDPDSLRTMKGDTNSLIRMVNDKSIGSGVENAVESAFKDEVERVYGSSGFMGLGKVVGINSRDWGLMRGLSANEVVKYFTGDSEQTSLPTNIVSELTKSSKHQTFGKQLLGLIGETEGKVKPYENEKVADFLKRLGKFVMEKHTNKSPGVNVGMGGGMKMAA